MESRVTLFGHPLHAMLVVFPLGMFLVAFLFDLVYLWCKDPFWRRGAFWLIAIGEAGAIAAIIPGIWDYLAIPMPLPVRRLATLHLLLGLTVTLLYGLQVWLRRKDAGCEPPSHRYSPARFFLTLLSTAAVGIQGWLGGQLSHIHGVGVMPEPRASRRDDRAKPVSGAEVYQRVCAGCHGTRGEGDVGPRLAGSEHPHEEEEIVKIVRQGRAPLMPAFENQLSPEEIRAVATYVHSLMRAGEGRPAAPGHSENSGGAR